MRTKRHDCPVCDGKGKVSGEELEHLRHFVQLASAIQKIFDTISENPDLLKALGIEMPGGVELGDDDRDFLSSLNISPE
jgi:hypothetical protein